MERRSITIHDVAADAHVSIATVSRVLNEPWRVLPETKQRVTESISKLGYVPNIRARLLAKGDSGTICFLLCNRPFAHSVHAQVLQGAADRAEVLGLQVVYAACNYTPDTPPPDIRIPRMLVARGLVDGVVVAGTNYPNMLHALDELELPYVIYGSNYVTGSDEMLTNGVYIDDEQGGYLAGRKLISLGHTSIGFVGDTSLPYYRRRFAGLRRAVSEAGLECCDAAGVADQGEMAMGYNGTLELLDRGVRFTGLFVGGDGGALWAIRALRSRGISVPGDVSIVGFNNEEIARLAEPRLTTVHAPNEDAGMRCIDVLQSIVDNTRKEEAPVVLPVELVERESTGQAPVLRV